MGLDFPIVTGASGSSGSSQLTPNFPSGLTAKGQPLNNTQTHCAFVLLTIGKSLNAPTVALVACIWDAIFESDLGLDVQWNPTYGGALAGNVSTFGTFGSPGSDAVTQAEAQQFFAGGNGYQGGGAIHLAAQSGDAKWIGSQVTAAVPYDSNGYSTQYESQNVPGGLDGVLKEAEAIVAAFGGGQLGGGTQGLGGTGGTANQPGNFFIGDTSNPDEDYWTGLNRNAQAAYWYCFSDGEQLYIADGTLLMQQAPARVINRFDPAILSMDGSWDNASWSFVANHKRRGRIQRKSTLAKVTSPTELTVELICDIDDLRGGDVVIVAGLGPMDGRWLVGDCERSVFEVFSTLTLVPALAPVNAAAGVGPAGSGAKAGGTSTGSAAGLSSPFTKKYSASLANVDMGVDFGTQQGISPGDPILAIADCYLTSTSTFYAGQPAMWFKFAGSPNSYWGWYVAEQINMKLSPSSSTLIKAGTVVATFASSGTGIEIGFAGADGQTATQALHPSEVAGRHDGNGTTDGRAFFSFLQAVHAV